MPALNRCEVCRKTEDATMQRQTTRTAGCALSRMARLARSSTGTRKQSVPPRCTGDGDSAHPSPREREHHGDVLHQSQSLTFVLPHPKARNVTSVVSNGTLLGTLNSPSALHAVGFGSLAYVGHDLVAEVPKVPTLKKRIATSDVIRSQMATQVVNLRLTGGAVEPTAGLGHHPAE